MTNEFWKAVKAGLKNKNKNNKLLQTWFDPTDLISMEEKDGQTLIKLGVPTELHKYWISENLFDRICSEISAIYQKPFEIELYVIEKQLSFDITSMNKESHDPSKNQYQQKELSASQKTPLIVENTNYQQQKRRDVLNPDHTFSTFVVGRNNEFAHAASFNIAQNPGSNGYNPLFIYGPTGMGKTHLLNAVGNTIKQTFNNLRVCYVSSERFLNECIACIRRNEMDKFRQKYREQFEVLLIDDVQILGRGEAVQDEFFHTINDFFEKHHQVVVASDRMPKEIRGLEDRIRTRLEWGLIADIQMPDIETRVAILKYKAEKKNIKLHEDVIHYISRISKRSIRELEGNLNKIKMFSELQGLEINLELTKQVLSQHTENTPLSIEDIQRITAEHFQIRPCDIISHNRVKPFVTARQVAMFLAKKHLDRSLVDIGRAFGGKDHSTVINAIKRINEQQFQDLDLKRDIEDLEEAIYKSTGLST